MADLAELDRALAVKLAGANNSTGIAENFVNADVNGNLNVVTTSAGPVTPNTAAASSELIGGQYNTSLPTLTTGQQAAIQVDSSARIIVRNSELPTTVDTNYGVVGANTIRTAAQIGNATGAASFGVGATGAQTLRVAANTYDGSGNAITSDNNGNANNQRLHFTVPDTTTTTTALGALNAFVSVSMAGLYSVGFQLAAGTLIGTITPQCSVDGGTSWTNCTFYNPNTNSTSPNMVFTSANTLQILSIVPIGGSSNIRVLVTAYTSGTANALLRATEVAGVTQTQASPLPPTGSGFAFGDLTTTTSSAYLKVERTTYTEQAANTQMSIASSSANDTSAGTGARTVSITYLDSTGAGPFTTSIVLSGVTFVNASVSNMCFIEKITIISVGSGGLNAGLLTLKASPAGAGTTVGTVAIGDNQTLWAHHYVPIGKTSYISGLSFSSSSTAAGNGALFALFSQNLPLGNNPNIQVSDTNTLTGVAASTTTRSYISPIQVVGPARIAAYAFPQNNASTVQRASFDYIDN